MIANSIQIRDAFVEDAPVLSGVAVRSKAHWGYSVEFMEAALAELTVLPADIENDDYSVALVAGEIVGFCCLENQTADSIELGALFVEPDFIGRGVGKLLLAEAKKRAVALGAEKLTIQSDPFAEGFYLSVGAVRIGEKASGSIVGRFLPLLEIGL